MNAKKIEQRAAEWLERRDQPEWSIHDQASLDDWLAASTEHKLAFWRLEHGWAKVGRLAALREVAAPDAPTFSRFVSWKPFALAASMAAVVALGALIAIPRFNEERYTTPIGGRQMVPLRDGSRIELATDTRIRTKVTAEAREVWIDRGEVYFEVKRDAQRPFVVWAGKRKVVVLGTTFSVRRDNGKVRVAVVEGRVRVEPAEANQKTRAEVLTPGRMAVAQGASTLVTDASPDKVANSLSWRRGMLTFDYTTLSEAAAEFNRYNQVKLVVGDADTAQMRIGGTFEAKNAQAFATLLGSAYELRLVHRKDEIEISR